MALLTSVNIGTTGGINTASVDYRVEDVRLQNGLMQAIHPRELTFTISKEKTFGDAWGIYGNDDSNNIAEWGGVIFDSATHTLTDLISDRQMASKSEVATSTNGVDSFTPPTGAQIIQYTENMIYLGYTETLSLTLQYSAETVGNLIHNITKPGMRLTNEFTIRPALAAVGLPTTLPPYIYCAGVRSGYDYIDSFMVTSVNFTQSSGDWHKAAIELTRTISNTSGNTSVSALLPKMQLWYTGGAWQSLGTDYMPADEMPAFYQVTITTNLTAGGSPTLTESVEVYPDKDSYSLLDTGYTPS